MSLADIHKRNEQHRTHRAGWLRAAVLGANDGLVSVASLMIGVVSAQRNDFVVTAGLAGIAAGAMSMAVGEYVSVRSQNDIENYRSNRLWRSSGHGNNCGRRSPRAFIRSLISPAKIRL